MQGTYSEWREEYDKNTAQKSNETYGKRYAEGEPSVNKKKKGKIKFLILFVYETKGTN